MQIKNSKFVRFFAVILLVQTFMPHAVEGNQKGVIGGMALSGLAGIALGHSLANHQAHQKQQKEQQQQIPNGCYKQMSWEKDPQDPTKYVEIGRLICPPGVAPGPMPGQVQYAPINNIQYQQQQQQPQGAVPQYPASFHPPQQGFYVPQQQQQQQQQLSYPQYIQPVEQHNGGFGQFQQSDQQQLNEQHHYLGDRPIPSAAVLPPRQFGQPLFPDTVEVQQQNQTEFIYPVEKSNAGHGQYGPEVSQQQLNEQKHYLGDRPLPSSAVLPPHQHGQPLSTDTAEVHQQNQTEFIYPVEQSNDGHGQYGPEVSQQQLNEQKHYLGDRPLPSSAVLPPHQHGQPLSADTAEVHQQNQTESVYPVEQRNDGFGQYGPEVSQQQLNEQKHYLGDRPIPSAAVLPPRQFGQPLFPDTVEVQQQNQTEFIYPVEKSNAGHGQYGPEVSQQQLNEQKHYLGDRPLPSSAVLPPHQHGQPLSTDTAEVHQQNQTEFIYPVEQSNDGHGQYGPEVSQQQLNEQKHYLGDRPLPSSAVLPPRQYGQPLSPDTVEVQQQNQTESVYPVEQRNDGFGQYGPAVQYPNPNPNVVAQYPAQPETTKRPNRVHSFLDKFNEIRKAKSNQMKERLSTLVLKNRASNDEVATDPPTQPIVPTQNGTHFQSDEPVKPSQGSDNKRKSGKSSSDKVWQSNILLMLPLALLLISLQ